MNRLWALPALASLCLGCGAGGTSSGAATTARDVLPTDKRTLEDRPGEERAPVESELYALSGTTLFVQNPARGLAAIDVQVPDRPVVTAQLASVAGKGGELYLRGANVFVVFKESRALATRSEIAAVESQSTALVEASALSVPGWLLASRLVGDIVYLVTTETDRAWVSAVSIADPRRLVVVDQKQFDGEGADAYATSSTIWLEHRTKDPVFGTRVRAVDISSPTGALVEQGSISLRGEPRDRFHMDESGTTFRIVTSSGRAEGSNLYVLDASDKNRLVVEGSLERLAPGEDLHATRFVGDRAYVVTYQPTVIELEIVATDPLWVISLTDPKAPKVIGSLQVPGWSDYLFPRGNLLLAVGRGDLGARVAASLFDLTRPEQPREVRRVEFGVPAASSEANTDFRGVRIIEAGVLGATPLVVLPYTNNLRKDGKPAPEHRVQLLDLLADDLVLRGSVAEVGLIRRALPVGSRLYAVGDKTVAAIDVTNREAPANVASVVVGDPNAPEELTPVFIDTPIIKTKVVGGCALAPRASEPWTVAPLAAILLVGLALRRSARHTRRSASY